MFYNILSTLFNWQHLYEFKHTSGARRVYNIVFAKDYDPRQEKNKTTKSWRKAKRWVDQGCFVTPMGYIPNSTWLEATCGEINEFDLYSRKVLLNCGEMKPLGRCRKHYRRWM